MYQYVHTVLSQLCAIARHSAAPRHNNATPSSFVENNPTISHPSENWISKRNNEGEKHFVHLHRRSICSERSLCCCCESTENGPGAAFDFLPPFLLDQFRSIFLKNQALKFLTVAHDIALSLSLSLLLFTVALIS